MAKELCSFKLDQHTLAEMDAIAARIGAMHDGKPNRAAALRYAVASTAAAQKVLVPPPKKPKKTRK